jgi:hypothetical protein
MTFVGMCRMSSVAFIDYVDILHKSAAYPSTAADSDRADNSLVDDHHRPLRASELTDCQVRGTHGLQL